MVSSLNNALLTETGILKELDDLLETSNSCEGFKYRYDVAFNQPLQSLFDKSTELGMSEDVLTKSAVSLLVDLLFKTQLKYDLSEEIVDMFIDGEYINSVHEVLTRPLFVDNADLRQHFHALFDLLTAAVTILYKAWDLLSYLPYREGCYVNYVSKRADTIVLCISTNTVPEFDAYPSFATVDIRELTVLSAP